MKMDSNINNVLGAVPMQVKFCVSVYPARKREYLCAILGAIKRRIPNSNTMKI